ncbi:MAG: hypothetical protein IPM46_11515 [Flavobacteriales bacterium]|nr:hypothetical protein [Flavobacteriales bacterium]
MRVAILLASTIGTLAVHAQRLDPDQNPYWTRYAFVEDSSALVPLQGDYRVYYMQHGMWWNNMPLHYPVSPQVDERMRLKPLFGAGLPSFQATPARGRDSPDVKVVVVRGLDTMVVELSVYYRARGGEVEERCRTLDCTRRPPVVMPFRPGRYLPIGLPFTKEYYAMDDRAEQVDARTASLTKQFDVLWTRAMKEERVVPQLNMDTCRQELLLPPDLDPPKMPMRDAWVLRSGYCGTHFVRFPSVGVAAEYIITFVAHFPEQQREPVRIHVPIGDPADALTDVSDWPIGDHPVRLLANGREETFTLKLR